MDEPTELALAARHGDAAAATAFVRATQADVWRLCRHLGSPAGAEDLAQETAVKTRGLPAPDDLHPDHAGSVALQDLPTGPDDERREAFVLTQLAGLTYPAAADVCGCPVGTIRSRVARADAELVAAHAGRRGQETG